MVRCRRRPASTQPPLEVKGDGLFRHTHPPSRGAAGIADDGILENVWAHGEKLGAGFRCKYCSTARKGGGATRLRQHLAGRRGHVAACTQVPPQVRKAMRISLRNLKQRKNATKDYRTRMEEAVLHTMACSDDDNEREAHQIPVKMEEQVSLEEFPCSQRMKRHGTVEHGDDSGSESSAGASASDAGSCVGGRGVLPQKKFGKSGLRRLGRDAGHVPRQAPRQTPIDRIDNKETRSKLGKAWAKMFHANGIPGRKADCPYFRSAMKLTQQLGPGMFIPTGEEIDGIYLDAIEKELKEDLCQFKKEWEVYGVTIVCDSWTGPTMTSTVNFYLSCNSRMFFHKSVDATGKIENAGFLYGEIKQIIQDVGVQNVVQVVTDSGDSYKKACLKLIAEYNQIVWQPCAADTVNLMLEDIAKFPEVAQVMDSAEQIYKFFYSLDTLLAEMKAKVGGELVPPNATRFGAIFVFIQSFWDRKDKFSKWMLSKEWKRSTWSKKIEGKHAYGCLTSGPWWDKVKWVINALEPIYCLLCYADQQKGSSISGFMSRSISVHHELQERLGSGSSDFNRIMDVVNTRLTMLKSDNFMIAAGALNPEGHYSYKHSLCRERKYAHELTLAISKLADSTENAVDALCQLHQFISYRGIFGSTEARDAARRMTPAAWWMAFGRQYPAIQKFALRIVSQCSSSSGCERNSSTFDLLQMQQRNHLGHAKLCKLEYVHYNLRLRLRHSEGEKENDMSTVMHMMDDTLFPTGNPLMDWLDASICESELAMGEQGAPPMLPEAC
ncbi:uncharacterized protein [Lolium perenne]|uniref:uncharacterized protein n=1 Tax=Lolium perenne TaxID=4522 RepID=UPI0021F5CC7C|nr:uncharacterized protein LOC127344855 [Lolium perenne]